MTRLLTAVVIIGLLVGALIAPPWVFAVAVLLIALRAWQEYVNLATALGAVPAAAPGALLVVATAGSFYAAEPSSTLAVLVGVWAFLSLNEFDSTGEPEAVVAAALEDIYETAARSPSYRRRSPVYSFWSGREAW